MQESRIIKTFGVSAMFVITLGSSCYGSSGPDDRFPFKYQAYSAIEISPDERFIVAFIGKDRIFRENWISLFDSEGNRLDASNCGYRNPRNIVWDASSEYFLAVNEKEMACLFQVDDRELVLINQFKYPADVIIGGGDFSKGHFYVFGKTEPPGLLDRSSGKLFRLEIGNSSELEELASIEGISSGTVRVVYPSVRTLEDTLVWRSDCIEEWNLNTETIVNAACRDYAISDYPVVDFIAASHGEVWGIDMRDNVFTWDWKHATLQARFKLDLPLVQLSAHDSGLYALRSIDREDGHIRHYSRDGKVLRTIKAPWDNVFCMDLSKNKLAVLSKTGEVFVTDL
ncbi:MAG TPA: hypothetical protein DEA96_03950 [Leptospiraceae bacterium]|nr:hypothetical protein [Leptospiraceae bacterium]